MGDMKVSFLGQVHHAINEYLTQIGYPTLPLACELFFTYVDTLSCILGCNKRTLLLFWLLRINRLLVLQERKSDKM